MPAYAVALTADEGGIRVTCRDLPELLTWGDNEAEALEMAADALLVVMEAARDEGRLLPAPSAALAGERVVEAAGGIG